MIPLHDDNPTVHRAWATLFLILLCGLVYFFVQPTPFASTGADGAFEFRHAAVPTEVVHGRPLNACEVVEGITRQKASSTVCNQPGSLAPYAQGKRTRLAVISSIFLHASIIHLLGNMLYLWIFGNNIEDRMRPLAFLIFFLVGGIVATMAHILADPASTTPVVGASGAVAAVMGAYFIWYPKAKVSTLVFVLILRIRAFWLLLVWLVLQFFTGSNSHVAWVAHVAGFVFGAGVALIIGPAKAQAPLSSSPAI